MHFGEVIPILPLPPPTQLGWGEVEWGGMGLGRDGMGLGGGGGKGCNRMGEEGVNGMGRRRGAMGWGEEGVG